MIQKIITAIIGALIKELPSLIARGGQALLKKVSEWNDKRKRKKENKKKLKEHQDAQTADDQQDSFNRLP